MTTIVETVPVPLRDGIVLAADVYRPQTEARVPALLLRTPYNKDASLSPAILHYTRAGYAVVIQDTRGRFASAGTFTPFVHEADDGADTVAWAAAQPWSNGRVGMIGSSYVGATQWAAASQSPEALGAIAPSLTATDLQQHWCFQGGAFELGFCAYWLLTSLLPGEIQRQIALGQRDNGAFAALMDAIDQLDTQYASWPLHSADLIAAAPYYLEWLRHAEDAAYWQQLSPSTAFGQITIPALNIGGWHDIFLRGTLANYQGMLQAGGSESARTQQQLIIGPWTHGVQTGIFAERNYGFRASSDVFDLVGQQLSWFDRWLKDDTRVASTPVQLFVMGANTWHSAPSWPLPGTEFRSYYLQSNGHANTQHGDGSLAPTAPQTDAADVFLYDPRSPVPTIGGQTLLVGHSVSSRAGPWDHRAIEGREDVLCYSTPPLDHALQVIGPLTLVLFVSSSAVDTDFIGRVLDIWPDGRAEIVTDGMLRARYRAGMAHPALLQPGHSYELQLDLGATANVFAAGHRVRLEITSSNFPRFDVNDNTGAGFLAAVAPVPALNTILHDRLHPSHLVLPIVEL